MRRIALVVFGDPSELPPTLNVAHVLARRGWEVDLCGIRWRGRARAGDGYPEGVTLRIALETRRGLRQAVDHLRFEAWCLALARKRRYQWIYAFDLAAAAVGSAMALFCRARFAYHVHDLAPSGSLSPMQRLLLLKPRERAAARRADLVVLPQPERARLFSDEARLPRPPVVVLNCPPLDWPERAAEVPPQVARAASRWRRLVVYQGGLNRARGVDALIASVRHWPEDSALVLVGDPGRSPDAASLQSQSRALGDRVVWAGLVPYGALPAVTRAARLGVAITPGAASDVNLAHMAGASNKVFEYLACGLPILAPDTPGFFELVEQPGHGRICRDSSPRALAAQIAELLDDDRFAAISERNRRAFRERYHYEEQLRPVLAHLEGTA